MSLSQNTLVWGIEVSTDPHRAGFFWHHYHNVGSLTRHTTPSDSILEMSFPTFFLSRGRHSLEWRGKMVEQQASIDLLPVRKCAKACNEAGVLVRPLNSIHLFNAQMADRSRRFCCSFLKLCTVWVHDRSLYDIEAGNSPITARGLLSGPHSLLVELCSSMTLRESKLLSDITVTSVPVSILNDTSWSVGESGQVRMCHF